MANKTATFQPTKQAKKIDKKKGGLKMKTVRIYAEWLVDGVFGQGNYSSYEDYFRETPMYTDYFHAVIWHGDKKYTVEY